MKYLLDSDLVADWLNGQPEAIQLFSSIQQDGLAMSLISYGEIYEGIYFGRDPQAAEAGLRNLLRFVDVLPLSRAILKRFAQIRGQLRQQGRLIADMDLLIAATAVHHGLTLVTRNLRHFQRIPNLQLHQ
jgi:tRNA(fMet)-specific endonuclease VapC